MSYLPINVYQQSPFISPISREAVGLQIALLAPGLNSAQAYPSANLATYVPFSLSRSIVVTQLWVANGTVAAGNIDIGIYSVDGARLTSLGSTAMAGTSVLQGSTITNITIGPGQYYLAFACSSTSAHILSVTSAAYKIRTLGVYQQASALPLPASATFATNTTPVNLPIFGLTTQATL